MRRDRVGFVFQAFNLVPTLTAEENITLPLTLAGRKATGVDRQRHRHGRPRATGCEHRPSELSGGQQQRVAVARALASRPQIIFADEPTGNLDSRAGAEVLAFMRQAVDEMGQTIVMVTHDPTAAATPTGSCSSPTADRRRDAPADARAGARAHEAVRGVTRRCADHHGRPLRHKLRL